MSESGEKRKINLIDNTLVYLRDITEKKIIIRMYKKQEKAYRYTTIKDSPALLYRGY